LRYEILAAQYNVLGKIKVSALELLDVVFIPLTFRGRGLE
jgi:hypothetical protein